MNYENQIKAISEIGLKVLLPETQDQLKQKEEACLAQIKAKKYIKIPIVGLFSAGKTSLINSLVSQNGLLPVDIGPETAIPCEIYYVDDISKQYAEIFRKDEKIFEGSIDDYGKFDVIPGDYGKAYIYSDFIKDCTDRGIVLVDMPGADSGIKEHNEAIIRYVKEGAAFSIIVSAKNGSLTPQEIGFIKEINEYHIPCSLFLSKIDLVAEEDIEDIMGICKDQFHYYTDEEAYVGTVCAAKNNVGAFISWINSINVDELDNKRQAPIVKAYLDEVKSAIQTYRDLLISNSNIGDIDSQIHTLEEQIEEINNVLNEAIANADTPEKSTIDILDSVRNDMIQNGRLVAEAIMTGSSIQVDETIMSVIRPALLKALAVEQEQFVNALKTELDTVTRRLLENIQIPGDLLDELISKNEDTIIGYLQILADRLIQSENSWAVLIGNVLRFIAQYVPEFLRQITGGEERAIRRVQEKFVGPFTTQILESLRPVVLEQVKIQQAHILDGVRLQYSQKIAQIKEALNDLQRLREENESDLGKKIEILDETLVNLSSIYNDL